METDISPCTNTFTTIMGLSCAHHIANIRRDTPDATLSLNDFNKHWWIDESTDFPGGQVNQTMDEGGSGDGDIQPLVDRIIERYNQGNLQQHIQARQRLEEIAFGPSPPLLDPAVRSGRGRPTGSTRHNTSSTQRDSSAFELAERTPRRCGRCSQPGHIYRNCPK
ncbi:hypothetical protein BC941DRAFT_442819 [Chlamydoabsidia padenii]|nr:hypothetical protein BC941DRAFT_442819 [Chlamydoabsidia padenii]